MIFTKDFATKTEVVPKNNGKKDGIWEIAPDLGYQGVKTYSPNSYSRFPSFAKRIDKEIEFASNVPNNCIQFRGSDGAYWVIGEYAYAILKPGDTSDNDSALYGRERYMQPWFKAIAETALGLAMMDNKIYTPSPSDRIVVQTGLPELYLNDQDELKEVLSGKHEFSLKLGPRPWQNFSMDIKYEDVHVMSQPKGTLFSVCIEENGKASVQASEFLKSSGLVFDAGFGTLDIFTLLRGSVGDGETFSDLGMKRVMQETVTQLNDKYHMSLSIPQLLKALPTGKVRHVRGLKSEEIDFSTILEDSNRKVCEEAIERLAGSIPLGEYNYMIVTGGTGDAWYDIIKDKFKDFSTLQIVRGNVNGRFPMVYANARGYYLYRYNKILREDR